MILCASIVCSEEQEKDDPATWVRRTRAGQPQRRVEVKEKDDPASRVRQTRAGQPQRRVEVKKVTTRQPGCVELALVNPSGE